MKLVCGLLECQGPAGCTRYNTRLKTKLKWCIANAKQDYKNKLWPLFCSPTSSCAIIQVHEGEDGSVTNLMPSLFPELLSHIGTYLEPRELFNLVFLNQKVMDLLTIETVMRSAMLAGVHAQETIKEIVSLLDDGIIYPPSALQLLCLVNGIRCKICNKKLSIMFARVMEYLFVGIV